jgi:ABC-type transport system involved in cytochrome bd biosynthesis fused ATPase/permease subunit
LAYATNKKLSDEDLYSVLKKVDLYKLVFNSKEKLNTEIGER